MKETFLIIDGPARSGTTLTSALLNRINESIILTETIRLPWIYKNISGKNNYPFILQKIFYEEGWLFEDINIGDSIKMINGVIDAYIPDKDIVKTKSKFQENILSYTNPSYCDLFYCFNRSINLDNKYRFIGGKTTFCHNYAKDMLNHIQELKWISIVRDPRAVFDSGSKVGIYNKNQLWITDYIYEFHRALNDLQNCFPERSMIIKYEDLVEKTQFVETQLEEFLGCTISKNQSEIINSKGDNFGTHSSYSEDGKPLNTIEFRSINSPEKIQTTPLYRWKKVMNKEEIVFYTLLYSQFISRYGYDECDVNKLSLGSWLYLRYVQVLNIFRDIKLVRNIISNYYSLKDFLKKKFYKREI